MAKTGFNCPPAIIDAIEQARVNLSEGWEVPEGDDERVILELVSVDEPTLRDIMNAVLDCSVCAERGGNDCIANVALNVVAAADVRGVLPDEEKTENGYYDRSIKANDWGKSLDSDLE